jgi:hypothetical protein
VSVLLSGLFLGLMFASQDRAGPLGVMWTWLWLLNLAVGIFNLLPGFPMDGGRLFRATLWAVTGSYRWATLIAGWSGRTLALGMVLLGALIVAHVPGTPLGAEPLNGLWLVLLGIYLDGAARQALAVQRLLEHLRRFRAEEFMLHVSRVPVVEAGARLLDFLPGLLAERDCDAAFVAEYGDDQEDGGRMIGMVERGRAVTVPERDRGRLTALDVMQPAEGMQPARPDDDAASLLQRLESEELVAVPVVAEGEVLGLVARRNLLRLIERRGHS